MERGTSRRTVTSRLSAGMALVLAGGVEAGTSAHSEHQRFRKTALAGTPPRTVRGSGCKKRCSVTLRTALRTVLLSVAERGPSVIPVPPVQTYVTFC
jgi:hypothetical protein